MRINIDESFFTDERIFYASQLIGEHLWMTESRLQRLWLSCFRDVTWLRTARQINMAMQFPTAVEALLESDLIAPEPDGFFRIRGIEKRIQFLIDSSRNGKKSAAARKSKYGTSAPIKAGSSSNEGTFEGLPKVPSEVVRRDPEAPPKGSRTTHEPPPPSPAPDLNTKISKGAEVLPVAPAPGSNLSTLKELKKSQTNQAVARLIGTYVKAWQTARKTRERPPVTKAFGIFPKLLEDYPEAKIGHCLEAYCQIKDKWFENNGWDLATFQAKFARILLALDKGDPSGIDWEFVLGKESTGVSL